MTPHNPTRQPIEIHRIPVSGPRRSNCPRCGMEIFTPGKTSFIVACEVSRGRVLPVCHNCAAGEDSTIAEAVACLNRLAQCLPLLEWRHATRCIGALDLLAQEVVDSTPPEQVRKTTGGRAAVDRAVMAMIARQCFAVADISVRDTVGAADPWDVMESLANLIASRIEHENDDVEGWIQSTFLELAADEDAE